MGSPLGPILADIFIGYVETFLLQHSDSTPRHYFRFVDDTFAVFQHPHSAAKYLDILNSIHPSLEFTCELEKCDALPFLDVLVHKTQSGHPNTSVYRKPTWSGLYLHFLSFAPIKYKRNLVRNLFDRARRICSPTHLEAEFSLLRSVLQANGYPTKFIDANSALQMKAEGTVIGPQKKKVLLCVPFLGDSFSHQVERRVRRVTSLTFPSAEPRIVFTTSKICVRSRKDKVSQLCQSNVVYSFKCNCGSSYIGRTERSLASRISEHLPKWLMSGAKHRPRSTAPPTSAVTRHALSCLTFDVHKEASDYFSTVVKARFARHLAILESIFIEREKPPLCIQKDFIYTLLLPWQR